METNTIEDVKIAIAMLFTNGKMITAKSFIGMFEGDKAKERRAIYNKAKSVYLDALNASKDTLTVKARHKASLVNRSKHRTVESAGMKEGSVLDVISEDERKLKSKLFSTALHDKLTIMESGLTEAEFITLAKHGGWISSGYREENSAGNYVLTMAGCKRWVAQYDTDCTALRVSDKIKESQSKKTKQAA